MDVQRARMGAMRDHDHAYKLLFSHAEMVRDLLEGFVKGEWLSQLHYESLERVGSSYVSDDLRERSDDVVWRVRWGKNWIYIYLLMEFQSTVGRTWPCGSRRISASCIRT
jgi:predicted transposase YdaD